MRGNRQRKSFIQSCLVRRLVSICCVALLLLFIFLPVVSAQMFDGDSIDKKTVSNDPIGDSVDEPISDSMDKIIVSNDPIDNSVDEPISNPVGDSVDEPISDSIDGDSMDKIIVSNDPIGDSVDEPISDLIDDSIDKIIVCDNSIDKNAIYETTYYTREGDETAGNIVTLRVDVGNITAGNRTEIAIEDTQGRACVNLIDSTSRTDLTNVSVHITRLDARPVEIQEEPIKNGIVYEYLDLKITENDSYIENMNASIGFKVRQEWIIENNIDISSMRLMRYHNNKWQELNTTLLDKNNTNVSFITETPGFSTFAVVGSANVMSSDTYAPETANIPLDAIIGIIAMIVALLVIVLFKARYIYFGEDHPIEKSKKKIKKENKK